jgi:hypothetical protein
MEQTKAQALHHKIDSLAEGMSKRLMEVYNELANLRFVNNIIVEQFKDSMGEIYEEEILNEIQNYYLLHDEAIINIEEKALYIFHPITRKYKLETVKEPTKDSQGKYEFKYEGIIQNIEDSREQDHTVEAANEQHAWSLLREILINGEQNKSA